MARSQPGVTYTTTSADATAVASAVADVTGDGKPDLIVLNANNDPHTPGSFSICVGNGDGTFQASVEYPTAVNPHSMSVTDVSGDGVPDIIVGNDDGGVSVLIGTGHGTFQPIASYGADSTCDLWRSRTSTAMAAWILCSQTRAATPSAFFSEAEPARSHPASNILPAQVPRSSRLET